MIIKDIHVEQSMQLEFSHFGTESVFFEIKFNTPIGNIYVDPKKHFSSTYIGDLKNISQHILDGLMNNLPVIKTGCMEPLFNISIYRFPEEKDVFTFRIELDLKKILNNEPNDSGPCLSLIVNRSSLEELAVFFNKIYQDYQLSKKTM